MTEPPLVTIMIPTYEQPDLLPRAIDSARAQTWPALEIVVSDDASGYDLAPIRARYAADPRVRIARHGRNVGRVENYRRTLVERAAGTWVLNLDADDWLADRAYVADAMAEAARRPEVVMIVAGAAVAGEPQGVRARAPTAAAWQQVRGRDYFAAWTPDTVLPHLSTLYRRDVALAIGFYQDDILAADAQSLLRLALEGDVLLTRRVVAIWTAHGNNASSSLDPARHVANLRMLSVPAAHARARGLPPREVAAWLDRNLARHLEVHLEECLGRGRPGAALGFLRGAARAHPAAAGRAIARLATRPAALAKLALATAGGPPLLDAARAACGRLPGRKVS